MKPILKALIDEIHYPVGVGHIENRLLARGLDPKGDCTADVINSDSFKGAKADTLRYLLTAPNFSDSVRSITQTDKDLIIDIMNALYSEIGEDESVVETPVVYMGDAVWQ